MADVTELRPSSCRPLHAAGMPVRVVDLATARAARRRGVLTASLTLPVDPLLFWRPLLALWAALWLAPLGLRVEVAEARSERREAGLARARRPRP